MKKFLLLAALFATTGVMAQEESLTDITPKAYDWASQEVGTKMVISHYDESWNDANDFACKLGGSVYLANGGCISAQNTKDIQSLMDGTAVVDLGGNIGKVMCINGANSHAQDSLGFTTAASVNAPMQICLYTNPDNTPRKQWIRCKMVFNIFSNTISTTDGVIANMYFMDADNNNKTAGMTDVNAINSAQFAEYDDEGDPVLDDNEDYIYDKNRWLTFEVDFYLMDEYKCDNYEGKTSQCMPAKWKIWMPQAGLAKSTIFIKELKFYTIDGYTDDKDETKWPAYANKPHLTYGPCPGNVDGIASIGNTSNKRQGIYNLAGQRVSKAQRGIYIVDGRKVVK